MGIENIMDITILHLLQYDINLEDLSHLGRKIRYVDFFFPNKRLIYSNCLDTQAYQYIQEIINSKDILFNHSILDSIYILKAFNLPEDIINSFLNSGYTTISSIRKLDSYMFKSITKNSFDSSYKKFLKVISQYSNWNSRKQNIIIEIILLDYLQTKEEASLKDLFFYTEKYFSENSIHFIPYEFDKVIKEMHRIKLIKLKPNGTALFKRMGISEMFSSLLEDNHIFKLYIDDFTNNNIEKERKFIAPKKTSLFSDILKLFPPIKEDIKYRNIFELYDFTELDFKILFNETKQVYDYLNNKYTRGFESVISYLEDSNCSEELIRDYLYKLNSSSNYKYEILSIDYNFKDFFKYFMSKNKFEILTYSLALKKINFLLSKVNINSLREVNLRDLKIQINSNSDILEFGKVNFRYYNSENLDQIQINLFKECFNLSDGVYTANKLYDLNIEKMYLLKLYDGEELMALYSKTRLNIPDIRINKNSSYIQIGNLGLFEFTKDSLLKFNDEHLSKVTWYLFEVYGLHPKKMTDYIKTEFDKFIIDNRIKINNPAVNYGHIIRYLNQELTEEIYLLEDVRYMIRKNFNETILINKVLLKNTKYKLIQDYIIYQAFTNPLEAMKKLIVKDGIFRIPDDNLSKDSIYYSATYQLQESFDIFRVSETSFITKKRLLEGRIDINDILQFIKSVEYYHIDFSDYKYFTLKSILKEGFNNKLIEMGFENIFYEEILRNSTELSFINTKPKIFYLNSDGKKIRRDFIYNLVEINNSIDYQDLIYKLLNTYGLSYDMYNLNYVLDDSPAYYSDITERYYKNKNQYYLEVYGK